MLWLPMFCVLSCHVIGAFSQVSVPKQDANLGHQAAAKVLSAHFAFNNYYNEVQPMQLLADLGTAIPRPAFAKSMEAILAVWLGNAWGKSFDGSAIAERMLTSLRQQQWEYYLNECLRRDRTVLDKVALDDKPAKRWMQLVAMFELNQLSLTSVRVRKLVEKSLTGNLQEVQERARRIREVVTE